MQDMRAYPPTPPPLPKKRKTNKNIIKRNSHLLWTTSMHEYTDFMSKCQTNVNINATTSKCDRMILLHAYL